MSICVQSMSLGSSYTRACTEYLQPPTLHQLVAAPTVCNLAIRWFAAIFLWYLCIRRLHYVYLFHFIKQCSQPRPGVYVVVFHVGMHYLAKIASKSPCSQVTAIQLDLDLVKKHNIWLSIRSIACAVAHTYRHLLWW